MPELPDVEGFRRVLADCAQGRTIKRVDVRDTGVLHEVSAQRFRRDLEGRRFTEPERRGKWLLARTGGPTVLLHFGMTGRLVCARADEDLHAHDRVLFTLGNERQLRYRDMRKLKGLWLAEDRDAAQLLDQGPDALSVSRTDFEAALAGKRGGLKSALMDQSLLAGLGNLLADEILWQAKLHPARSTASLSDDERANLYRTMRRVLRSSVSAGQVPPRDTWLTGHRDAPHNAPCPRCGTHLRSTRIAGRTTLWCPHCQPAPN
ncbi:Fpg/Nei family DNA glycosylase [Streptomyces iconiensis]|uniref:DNA-formamidopyrimidine glycosylase family protein n=1 Tax=Streptomyces iconiensis TaxID=1384038 RepID=A0ABT6ZTG2_9ACTN|nr:DNA-formamidopyrimidine glycosylase family protein [Streptomyces iconiensis]MDJ1131921.1 DNA-formamidopyrimidine glycosylase family protein [Streptomyces iconiensis]